MPRRPAFAESLLASACPVLNESAAEATSSDARRRSVRSNFVTLTDSEPSRIVVPWISPALEQPTTTERG